MSLSPERRGKIVMLPSQPWHQQQALTPTLPVMLMGRGEGHLAGRTSGGQSTLAQERVRSVVMSDGKAECKLQKFMKLFLLSEQIQISGVLIRQASFQLCQLSGRCWHALNPVFIGRSSLL